MQAFAQGRSESFVSATALPGQCEPVVPDVVGTTQTDAEAAINAVENFSVGTVTTECNDTVPAGHVIAQDPPPGPTECNDQVDLVLSSVQCTYTI